MTRPAGDDVRAAVLVEVLERIEAELTAATDHLLPGLERAWLVVKVDLAGDVIAGDVIAGDTSTFDAVEAAEQETS